MAPKKDGTLFAYERMARDRMARRVADKALLDAAKAVLAGWDEFTRDDFTGTIDTLAEAMPALREAVGLKIQSDPLRREDRASEERK